MSMGEEEEGMGPEGREKWAERVEEDLSVFVGSEGSGSR